MENLKFALLGLLWIGVLIGIALFIQGRRSNSVLQYKRGFLLIFLSWFTGITVLSIVTGLGFFLMGTCLGIIATFLIVINKELIRAKIRSFKKFNVRIKSILFRIQ